MIIFLIDIVVCVSIVAIYIIGSCVRLVGVSATRCAYYVIFLIGHS